MWALSKTERARQREGEVRDGMTASTQTTGRRPVVITLPASRPGGSSARGTLRTRSH
jgi:hypothetical protein